MSETLNPQTNESREQTGYSIRGWNAFYDGWLGWLLLQPDDELESYAWRDGWKMAEETGAIALSALPAEIAAGHIIVCNMEEEK